MCVSIHSVYWRERREWDGGCSCTHNRAQNIMAVTQSRKTIGGSDPAAWNLSPLASLNSSSFFIQSHLETNVRLHLVKHPLHTIGMKNPFTRQMITTS